MQVALSLCNAYPFNSKRRSFVINFASLTAITPEILRSKRLDAFQHTNPVI